MFRIKKIIKGISILCCLMTLILPIQAQAGIGLSFDLISFGPFSIGIDIPFALPLLGIVAAGAVLISFFSRFGRIFLCGIASERGTADNACQSNRQPGRSLDLFQKSFSPFNFNSKL